ncbi:MAG: hypothetical protein KCHDKBKB_00394 [Elusimicrobia bacterium]|nr:hypothetical protein [Elusimicrobiota bacterium]
MKREFDEIDRQFDETMERLGPKGALNSGAYGTGPLASDHFLLKKSWDYFRFRVKAIEDQWRKMLESKEQQLRIALTDLQETRKQRADLEEENHLLRSLELNVKKARAEDYVGFSRKSQNLRLHWDAERDNYLKKIEALELKITRMQKNFDLRSSTAQIRESKLNESFQALKQELNTHQEREREIQKKCSEELQMKDEKIYSLDSKMEMLRGEVERRDQVIQQLQQAFSRREQDATAMGQTITEYERLLKEKDKEMSHLSTRLQILINEKENLRAGWERERAEWRELWDRGRSLWEKKSS